jgi:hypothetical protein
MKQSIFTTVLADTKMTGYQIIFETTLIFDKIT